MNDWPGAPRPPKPPRGAGQPVLYLDFDGVLHHENVYWHPGRGCYLGPEEARAGHVLFQHVQLLEEVLAPHPAVRIVLSTSWAVQYGFAGAAQRLPPSLRERCIGATWHSDMVDRSSFMRLGRALQILQDVHRRQPGSWLAIDDDHGDWPAAREEHLVRSDPVMGLSAPAVLQNLREKLRMLSPEARPVAKTPPPAQERCG